MSYLLFVDESGQDGKASPYAVLAGVSVQDRDIWSFICQLQEAEERFFGCRISQNNLELKAKKLLKRKTFRLAGQTEPIPDEDRRNLALSCLQKGHQSHVEGRTQARVSREELSALAQAKLAFVHHILDLCLRNRFRVFASIFPPDAAKPGPEMLRKDYAFLFQRFFYFLEDVRGDHQGLVVFDELEHSACHLLVNQMHWYFQTTAKGRARSALVIPEPFFVHSDLTTLVQIADLTAYIISWGVRFAHMTQPARLELAPFAEKIELLRFKTERPDDNGRPWPVWGLKYIDDLRPRRELEEDDEE